MNAGVNDEATAFVGKFRARWPEWSIAQVFLPPEQRELAAHWFAMLQEWTDAATTAEPAPGLAKLAWWQEELRGWAKGARRHPLGIVLAREAVDWNALADALPALAPRGDQVDGEALQRFAQAISVAEQALFDEARDGAGTISNTLAHVLQAADAGASAVDGARPRRLLAALETARGTRGAMPLSPWATLRCSWRAARAGGAR